jgi:hypothetical protein
VDEWSEESVDERTDGEREDRRTGRQRDSYTRAANAAQMKPVGYTFAIIVAKCERNGPL